MGDPSMKLMEFPMAGGAVVAGIGKEENLADLYDKAYDFQRDGGAGFTAALEGSVAGLNWDVIVNLAASAQDDIDPKYKLVRINCSVGGALGATTQLSVVGVA